MIRMKSLHLGISLETIGLKKNAFIRFLGCQNRFMIRKIASWFWQHKIVQGNLILLSKSPHDSWNRFMISTTSDYAEKFAVAVKIVSWFVKSLHDFDSIRLCRKICCCCQNRFMIFDSSRLCRNQLSITNFLK